MKPTEELENASIIDTRFRGSIDEVVTVGGLKGIIPRIAGSAWITGLNQLVLDPADPLPEGFWSKLRKKDSCSFFAPRINVHDLQLWRVQKLVESQMWRFSSSLAQLNGL